VTEMSESWAEWIWDHEWMVIALEDRTGAISVQFVKRWNRESRITGANGRKPAATRTKEPELA
jgi:hypothetical protein